MNGNEEGVDCGGLCSPCSTETLSVLKLNIIVKPVEAEILDRYKLEIDIENAGEHEANDLTVLADKWAAETKTIPSIMPGMTEKQVLMLNLPGDPTVSSVNVQILQAGNLVQSQLVPVSLSIPSYSVKINNDPESGRLYQAVIVDNRDKLKRDIVVDMSISKDRDTYFVEFGKNYSVDENRVFSTVDYLYLKKLPAGEYEVEASFYENDEKVGQATSYVILGGDEKAFNPRFIFYFLLLAIVAGCMYLFLKTYKKSEE